MKNYIISIFIYLFITVIKADSSIILQSTTSLKNSGFYEYILPFIYKDLGIKVNVVAVGTGAAIRNSMNCDGDLLIVHSPQQEQNFMENGFSEKKHLISKPRKNRWAIVSEKCKKHKTCFACSAVQPDKYVKTDLCKFHGE